MRTKQKYTGITQFLIENINSQHNVNSVLNKSNWFHLSRFCRTDFESISDAEIILLLFVLSSTVQTIYFYRKYKLAFTRFCMKLTIKASSWNTFPSSASISHSGPSWTRICSRNHKSNIKPPTDAPTTTIPNRQSVNAFSLKEKKNQKSSL